MKRKKFTLCSIFLLSFVIWCFITSKDVYASINEREPDDSFGSAQTISIGEEYSGVVLDSNYDDEDYYRIPVIEGHFYKIDVYNMHDYEDDWSTLIVSLCKESNTDDSDTISNGDYRSTSKLFRAAYTGSYYLRFWNTRNTGYSFVVSDYSPIGKKVKDSSSNTYTITGNYKVEFSKVASKNSTSFYFNTEEYFSNIDGIDVLDYYNVPFTVTAIGNYAFKGSKIRYISIPKEIKIIGVGAFQNCKKLGSEKYIMGVVIYGKKVTIKKKAFYGCSKLGSFRVLKSASIKAVQKNAFKGTKKGIRLEVPNVKKYKKIFKNGGMKKPKYFKSYIS